MGPRMRQRTHKWTRINANGPEGETGFTEGNEGNGGNRTGRTTKHTKDTKKPSHAFEQLEPRMNAKEREYMIARTGFTGGKPREDRGERSTGLRPDPEPLRYAD